MQRSFFNLFLILGHGETLRVYGEARIVRDQTLLDRIVVHRRALQLALVAYVKGR